MSELYIVEGANPALLNNGMATRRGRKYHYAKEPNVFDEKNMDYDHSIRTLCNLVVYGDLQDAEDNEYYEHEVNCKNCLGLSKDNIEKSEG